MTIYDISEKAGVSIATVSRVLNGSPNVSDKTKNKVLAIIEESGYTPNVFARGLGLNTMNTIGILCADSSDLYLAKAVYFLEEHLRENGYDSILCCTGYDLETKKKCLNLLISKKVDSVILVGSSFVDIKDSNNNYIKEAAKQLPVMLLNASLDYPNVYSTLSDDFKATFAATDALLAQGLTDILYLYNASSYSGIKKLAGYEAAYKSRHLPVKSNLIHFYKGSREDIRGVIDLLISFKNKGLSFQGIITSDDSLALGAVKYAKSTKLNIPDDLSIIGYNNSMLTTCCDPELTSVDTKLSTLCEHLITNLMNVLVKRNVPKQTIFSCEIVKRGTTYF